jgi:hypothetical protein
VFTHNSGDNTNRVSGYDTTYFLPNLIKILDACQANGIGVYLSTFNFFGTRISDGGYTGAKATAYTAWRTTHQNAMKRIIQFPSDYITNALVPILNAIKNHPALYGIETADEPQIAGPEDANFATASEIANFCNQVASAIKNTAPHLVIASNFYNQSPGWDTYSPLMNLPPHTSVDIHKFSNETTGYVAFLTTGRSNVGGKKTLLSSHGPLDDVSDANELATVEVALNTTWDRGYRGYVAWEKNFFASANRTGLLSKLQTWKNKQYPNSPPPPPPPAIPPSPPPSSPQVDVFGINKIYTTKSGTQEWSATAWSNGQSRTIQRDEDLSASTCTKDPYDSRLAVIQVGDPKVTIDGNGFMRAGAMPDTTGSPRITVLGTWQNVESSVYVRCPSSAYGSAGMDLRVKTDHYCVGSGGFGGYIILLNFPEQAIYFRKEKTHDIGYSSRMGQVSFVLPVNTWIGVKSICYNLSNGHVKLEIWIDMNDGINGGNWVKRAEIIDDGSWPGSGGGTPIQTGSSGGSAIRTNMGDVVNTHLEYKKWTVREISSFS